MLFNSIKTGLAVDYPIFSSSVQPAIDAIEATKLSVPITNYSGLSLGTSTCFTGSAINSTIDSGIPRISGSVSRRVTFDDLIYPERLLGQEVYDNEAHPSASNLYGDRDFLKVVSHPPKFSVLDSDNVAINNGIDIDQNVESAIVSLLPYRSAINNFTAETVNFFLYDGNLNTITSAPSKPRLESGVVYKMRIYLENRGIFMYDRHSAFGPPVDEGLASLIKYDITGSSSTGSAAIANVDFNNYVNWCPSPGILPISLSGAHGFMNIYNSGSSFPGLSITSSIGTASNVVFYNSDDLTGSMVQIRINDDSKWGSQVQTGLGIASDSDAMGIQFSGAYGQASVKFYDSSLSSTTPTGGEFINVYNRTNEQIIGDIHDYLSSSLATSFEFYTSSANLTLFGKTTARKNDISVSVFPSNASTTASFQSYASTPSSEFCQISTASTNPRDFGPIDFEITNHLAFGSINGWQTLIDLYNSNNSSVLRFVNVSGAAGDATATALNFREMINDLNSDLSWGVTSSLGSDNSIVTLSQTNTGSAGNTVIQDRDLERAFFPSTTAPLVSFSAQSFVGSSPSAFAGGTDASTSTDKFLKKTEYQASCSHGYLPYVPPYLDKNTAPYAEISFTPGETREYTIPEIIEGMQVEYYNIEKPSNHLTNTNYKESMSISASIDFSKHVLLYSDNFHSVAGTVSRTVGTPSADLYRWVIQPKWETPVLDFQKVKVPALNLTTNQEEELQFSPWKTRKQTNYYEINHTNTNYLTASRGMWHQKGRVPTSANSGGYFLTIAGGSIDGKYGNTGDLAQACGFIEKSSNSQTTATDKPESFPKKSTRLGLLAKSKEISEAVVAIPYYMARCKDSGNVPTMSFFSMNKELFTEAQEYNENIRVRYIESLRSAQTFQEVTRRNGMYEALYENPGIQPIETTAYQLRMMDKYIMPPQFDFLKNSEIDPFVAYIFQFKADLSRDDLADIWQNIYPQSKWGAGICRHSKAERYTYSDVEFITHTLDKDAIPFLGNQASMYQDPGHFLAEKVRWLVFKIKLKAETNYSNIVRKSVSKIPENVIELDGIRQFQDIVERYFQAVDTQTKTIFDKASYNWPYDYFSLVEMVKVESKVDFFSPAPKQEPGEIPLISSNLPTIEDPGEMLFPEVSEFENLSTSDLNNLVQNQLVKADTDTVPSPANVLTINVDPGFTIRPNSEMVYVNGLLQTSGAGDDYTMAGNTVTFSYDVLSTDRVQVSYIKETT